jgi:hypothetical protein
MSSQPGATPVASGEDGSADTSPVTVGRLVSGAFRVFTPTVVMTALLFYFGWARTEAAAKRAGIDQSLFGFSTNDYLLRSVSPLFRPFGLGLLVMIVVIVSAGVANRHLAGWVASGRITRPQLRVASFVFALCGIAAVAAGAPWLGEVGTQRPAHLSATLIITGALLLRSALSLADMGGTEVGGSLSSQRGWLLGVVVALVLIGMFAIVLRLAFDDGAGSIEGFAAGLSASPEVIVTATVPLDITLPGVTTEIIDSPVADVGPRFRYRGLHLLLETNDRLFLVTPGFGRVGETSAVVVVPDTESLRLDFVIPS